MTNTYAELNDITENVKDTWNEAVIVNAFNEHKKMPIKDFLDDCIACGGNWGGMLLSGMKKHYPKTYEAIPEDMGHNAFLTICDTLTLCGVEW